MANKSTYFPRSSHFYKWEWFTNSKKYKKYNEILEELKRLRYWQEIDKRIENVKAGKGEFQELIEVDDI